MKKLFLILAVLSLVGCDSTDPHVQRFMGVSPAHAYNYETETATEAGDRRFVEQYQERQEAGGSAPLGGYSDKLGD